MDERRFDALARSLTDTSERRGLVRGLAATLLGLAAARLPGAVAARHRHKHRRTKKLVRNAFGCVDVGGKCRGNSANCCSGICQGNKPKKGKKDTSRCVAHNVGACQGDQDGCVAEEVPCGTDGVCLRTTGQASFCGLEFSGECRACQKDTDCEADFGLGAACLVCKGCDGFDTACMSAGAPA